MVIRELFRGNRKNEQDLCRIVLFLAGLQTTNSSSIICCSILVKKLLYNRLSGSKTTHQRFVHFNLDFLVS